MVAAWMAKGWVMPRASRARQIRSGTPSRAKVLEGLSAAGLDHIPVVVGGIIPDDDAEALRAQGVARVYTPKDFELNAIMSDFVALASERDAAA